jgi:serine/threonine protein kinase
LALLLDRSVVRCGLQCLVATLTRSNVDAVVGTPLYISPEAILTPDRIDARADIYGLGGVAYHLVTGVPPFEGKNVVEICAHHLHSAPRPPSQRGPVPDDLERVILSCLANDRNERPEGAEALARALERCRDASSWTEGDAEAWWTRRAWASSKQDVPRAVGPQRTISCDLEGRLWRNEGVA